MSGVFRFSAVVYATLAAVLFMALMSSPARAQENVVTVAECTEAELRQAIADASAGTTIDFGCDGEITLTEEGGDTPIVIDKDLTIDGVGRDVTISGGGEVGIFFNTNLATFTLKNLTLTEGAGIDQGEGFGGGSSGGGAIYNFAKLVVEGVSFIDNEAFDAGGAIYSRGPAAEVSVTGSTFEGNYVTCTGICSTHGGGGAIAALAGGETNITDSVFRGNTALGKDVGGGAIIGRRSFSASQIGPISISGSTFEDNKALTTNPDVRFRNGGGAVSVFNRELTITESEFTGNEATNADSAGTPGAGFNSQAFGGAVLIESENVPGDTAPLKGATISDTTFTENAATLPFSLGGALFILRAPTSISNATFTKNVAERTGAIDNAGASVSITDSTIENNTAIGATGELDTAGGVTMGSSGTQTMDGTQFKAETTFTRTTVSNNVNGNCAAESDEEIIDGGGNSETPGTSCGFNGAERVEKGRPTALDDRYEIEDGAATLTVPAPGVLENDTDPEGEAMSAELVGEPRSGTVVLNADGSFVYTPDAGASGDAFTYRVKSPDGLRQSRVARVSIDFTSEIVVNSDADTVADDGECTLREAVASANTNAASGSEPGECAAGSGKDEITFDLPDDAEITLGGGHIEIPSALAIDGSGVENLTVSGGGKSRVFFVSGGSVEMNDLTITGGADAEEAGTGIGGGAIFNSAQLTLTDMLVIGNTSKTDGGGIENDGGKLTVRASEFVDNTAERNGGAISNDFGALTVEGSTISGNTSTDGLGGGVLSTTENISEIEDPITKTVIRNSTISGNAASAGSGVYNDNGLAVIENSTITENNTVSASTGSGVASYGDDRTRTELHSSIIAANQH
ncbi:MAG: Ig-like domain-containing protein, partial [Rubrobacteraceae bacterium]